MVMDLFSSHLRVATVGLSALFFIMALLYYALSILTGLCVGLFLLSCW
jgi:hypothetical protein